MTAKKIIKYLCVFVVAPLIVLCGVFFFGDRKYAFISLALSVVACIPFFISFEKGKNEEKKEIILRMLNSKMSDSDIIKYSNVTESELENIKKSIGK